MKNYYALPQDRIIDELKEENKKLKVRINILQDQIIFIKDFIKTNN